MLSCEVVQKPSTENHCKVMLCLALLKLIAVIIIFIVIPGLDVVTGNECNLFLDLSISSLH